MSKTLKTLLAAAALASASMANASTRDNIVSHPICGLGGVYLKLKPANGVMTTKAEFKATLNKLGCIKKVNTASSTLTPATFDNGDKLERAYSKETNRLVRIVPANGDDMIYATVHGLTTSSDVQAAMGQSK